MAADKLEKQERTASIQPLQRLSPRAVNFLIAAVGTGFPANFQHAGCIHIRVGSHAERFRSSLLAWFGRCSVRISAFRYSCRRSDSKKLTASSSPQLLRCATTFMARSLAIWVREGGKYGFLFFSRSMSPCMSSLKSCHRQDALLGSFVLVTKSEQQIP